VWEGEGGAGAYHQLLAAVTTRLESHHVREAWAGREGYINPSSSLLLSFLITLA
jgi:hypothetical protein